MMTTLEMQRQQEQELVSAYVRIAEAAARMVAEGSMTVAEANEWACNAQDRAAGCPWSK